MTIPENIILFHISVFDAMDNLSYLFHISINKTLKTARVVKYSNRIRHPSRYELHQSMKRFNRSTDIMLFTG